MANLVDGAGYFVYWLTFVGVVIALRLLEKIGKQPTPKPKRKRK